MANLHSTPQKVYRNVLFAGTFDHLHAGHKHVLCEALNLSENMLYVALTTDELIARKRYSAALEPLVLRRKKVEDFMKSLVFATGSNVKVTFLETPDSIGPAASLNFDALIVTPETFSGGEAVNAARVCHGAPVVDVVCVSLFDDASVSDKMSSTRIRERICTQLLRGEEDLVRLKGLFNQISPSDLWWSTIRDMYSLGTSRFYHNLQHISEMLDFIEIDDPIELRLAVWFHDCVYDSKRFDNEESSVAVFTKFASDTDLSPSITNAVSDAIMMSKNHLRFLGEEIPFWTRKFLEMDLSIFGTHFERYRQYADQIAKEYLHVSDFEKKRCNFLKGISSLQFSALKNSDILNRRLKENIQWELLGLQNSI